ncbi:hypothetical protein D3C84_780360 [compost metagenome]
MRVGAGLGVGDAGQAHQGFVHLIDIAGRGPGLFPHGVNGVGVQRAQVVSGLRLAPAAVEHRLRAAFLQGRIV